MDYYNNEALEVILNHQKVANQNISTLNDNQKYINENLVEFINVFKGFIDDLKKENKLLKQDLNLVKSVFNINNDLVVRKTNDSLTMRKTDAEMIDVLNTVVNYNDVGTRTHTCLENANIRTNYDLVKCTKKQLMRIYRFGRQSYIYIEQHLSERNLSLGMDVSKYEPYLKQNEV